MNVDSLPQSSYPLSLPKDRDSTLIPLVDPFGHEIRQGLRLDHHLWHIGYVEPHELKRPLGDPSCGETIPDNFSEPK
jgi:hypothetical protein